MSLSEVTEEPHHSFSSFRVRGKIFVTVPTENSHLHIFVDEETRELMLQLEPNAVEKLYWGKRALGVRVNLALVSDESLIAMIDNAWRNKAPQNLLKI